MTLRIRMAQPGDEAGIALVSTLAFAPGKDALTTNLFPARLQPETGDPAMTAYPWRLSRKAWWIREGEGVMMVAVDDALDGKIVGFSLWESPREPGTKGPKEPSVPCPGFDPEEYASFRDHMETTIKGWFGEVGLSNMWYLDYLAVDPAHQRRGLGKMLLQWGLDKAQEEKRDAFLIATPAGTPLYSHMGFVAIHEVDLWGVEHLGMIKRHQEQ